MILIDLFIALMLLVGGFFTLVGSIGLLKLDKPMPRLHAPTKASTLGVGALLLASMVNGLVHHEAALHETLIMAFLFVTAPISANFIAKVHLHKEHNQDPVPAAPGDQVWATDMPPDADEARP